MSNIKRSFLAVFLAAIIILSSIGCSEDIKSLNICEGDSITMEVGATTRLTTDAPDNIKDKLLWNASYNAGITVDQNGTVTAQSEGQFTVCVAYGILTDTITVIVVNYEEPLPAVDEAARDAFYGNSDPADSYEEALERSAKGEISGADRVPDQTPYIADYRPTSNGMFIRNSFPYYEDENTYVVVNAYGQEVFRIYRGGGYITLEEVAAYVYAFGTVPANYVSDKKTKPTASIWGEYLRLNHSKFSGDTQRFPYEPELPDISGCGGDLQYYEIDIGTTGTDCDPNYSAQIYNNGRSITRGAARIVYSRFDKDGNNIIDVDEKFVFYTYNHYNDFQEYLNYYGGWGEMFGNITGGGKISSKTDYNPTPYVKVALSPIKLPDTVDLAIVYVYIDKQSLLCGGYQKFYA